MTAYRQMPRTLHSSAAHLCKLGLDSLVLWRMCDVLDHESVAKLCDKLAINQADSELDVAYINSDHNIPTALTLTVEEGGVTRVLKLRQMELEFLERMFNVEDV